MQNLFTILALSFWPLISALFFLILSFRSAVIWTVLGAQLLLPVGASIKFDMIPVFDKSTIPSLCILAGSFLTGLKRVRTRRFGLTELLLVGFVLGPIITSELNGDTLVYGDRIVAGVGLYDAISAAEFALISLIPFFIGRRYFRDGEANTVLLRNLVLAMACYSLPLLFEVRFSPQLHYWLYGYYPSDFIQAVRSGEFRPMAFMGHGLIAARFVLLAFIASVGLWTISTEAKLMFGRLSGWLAMMVYFCRTLSAIIYSAAFAPLIIYARPKLQVRVAALLALLALLYPALRSLDIFPTKLLLEATSSISEDRAGSLKVRFDNEDQLLARAFERPFFGWGRYGRSRVYDENSGVDTSVTDGEWIITFGQFGLFGFIAQFGLLSMGIFRSTKALARTSDLRDQRLLSTLTVMMTITLVDLLPNSGLEPWSWLMCGALVGRTDALLSPRASNAKVGQSLAPGLGPS
jgi:hypothetical protein